MKITKKTSDKEVLLADIQPNTVFRMAGTLEPLYLKTNGRDEARPKGVDPRDHDAYQMIFCVNLEHGALTSLHKDTYVIAFDSELIVS